MSATAFLCDSSSPDGADSKTLSPLNGNRKLFHNFQLFKPQFAIYGSILSHRCCHLLCLQLTPETPQFPGFLLLFFFFFFSFLFQRISVFFLSNPDSHQSAKGIWTWPYVYFLDSVKRVCFNLIDAKLDFILTIDLSFIAATT